MFDASHLKPNEANFRPLTPLDLLVRTVEVHGTRTGVAWRDHSWTYAEFGAMVGRMAGWLKSRGIGRGDVVSVILGNRPEMLAAHFAVPLLGAVLNSINTRLGPDETRYIVEHSGSRLLLCQPDTRSQADMLDIPVDLLCGGPGDAEGLDFLSDTGDALPLRVDIRSETDAIALNYTSGTTGKPKGVVCTHRGACLNAMGNVLALGLTAESRYLWTLPMFHCNGWCHTWAVTAAGGMHVCLDRVDPALILDTIAARNVTHMCCAPVVLYMLLDHDADAPPARVRVATGGAAPTPSLLSGLERMGFDLMHLYGLTESYGPATLNDPGLSAPSDLGERADLLARQGQRHITAGLASVVDPEGQTVPADGETLGEIVLRGNTVMAGYFRDPEATDTAFTGGQFHTGDLAVIHSDGQIEIRDRAKDVIISGGENISSLEVETVLQRHSDVLFAAVVAAPDAKWGETPWAFVELKAGRNTDAATLDAFCRLHLTGFKRPRRFVFRTLPRTSTGKIQKFILRDQAKEIAES